jgi:hypothetical protein
MFSTKMILKNLNSLMRFVSRSKSMSKKSTIDTLLLRIKI